MQKITLSIIVPVFNEEGTVGEVLFKLSHLKLLNGVGSEIFVVNDGSTDGSKDIILNSQKDFKINNFKLLTHPKNLGKGSAVISGIEKSTGDIITIQDADLEYDPNDLNKLLRPILEGRSEVVFGTRLKQYPLKISGKKKTPLITHYLGNKFLTLLTNILYGSSVTDMETCYKMMKRNVLQGINLKSKRFEFEAEITAKILKKGYKIFEVPIKVNPRGYEEGKKITWRDGFIAIWTLVKYRFVG
ncbi:MAG: hypothetical protein US62_C0029G0004 [Candidatus Woesebacteria bacterium GW2011_GWA1_37_8]|uniref:Glycosyltransferase 2-like domain-containing protein n=1 Tax=Candidatus Woesebacteria bacterium GW2011_GWA1_37_8 TaxID=1618546 RepID=A0A0G0HM64_9BACT|nr:MAG: hypothetical protein US39_C0004G0070 [Microgenomates group bacterium GW2011_GWC1_37_12b]KKQ44248.1 MAG: hypothetical protein US62_C0029G0004 [Candidatus Woesebacteria bacterium GW2011_GWA1_37_8]